MCPWSIFVKNFASFPSIFARISKFVHFHRDWAYAKPKFFLEISNKILFQNVHFRSIRWVPRRFFKIWIFYSWNLHFYLGFLSNYSMRMLSICGNDLSHTEHTRNVHFRPSRWVPRRFFKILIFYSWNLHFYLGFLSNYSMRMLSICGNDFIAHWACAERIFAYAQPSVKFWQFLHGHPNACWAYEEMISSHAEHTRKRFHRTLSICGNDFIACWAVLRIRDVYPGSWILIFTHSGSRIPDPKTATKERGEKK